MRTAKKIMLLFAWFIFPFYYVQAQDSIKQTYKKWLVGLSFSPDYCYRSLKAEPSSEIFLHNRNETEIPKFGYTAGASILWRVHRKLELESGIRYSDKGYRTDQFNLSWVSDDINLPSKYRIVYRYQYFDIPLKLNYHLLNKKFRVFITTGVSVNLFNRQQTKLIIEEKDGSRNSTLSENDLGFSTMNLSLFVGGGILYPITKSFSVRIQPLYRMSLTPLRPSEGFKEKLFSTGMEMGVYYTLR